jgi:hypothetical protein
VPVQVRVFVHGIVLVLVLVFVLGIRAGIGFAGSMA